MPTWTGWREQFEAALGVTDTSDNRDFLRDWAAHANSNCANNPIDVSRTARGSANCATLPGGRHAQRYTSHAQAAQAFALQMRSGNFPLLLQGFESGHPQATRTLALLVAELRAWGSAEFANFVNDQAGGGGGGGGGGGSSDVAPHAMKGWQAIRNEVNNTFPRTVRHVARINRATTAELSHHHRVRR